MNTTAIGGAAVSAAYAINYGIGCGLEMDRVSRTAMSDEKVQDHSDDLLNSFNKLKRKNSNMFALRFLKSNTVDVN